MRLLWLSHFVPFPPAGGHLQRSFNLIRQVSKRHETILVAFNLERETPERLKEHERELRRYCSAVEFWDLPRPWKSVGWYAQVALSPFFSQPFSCRAFWSAEVAARWRRKLEEHAGALLHFDSPDLALFATAAPGFRKVVNHHNCESELAYRRAARQRNPLNRAYLTSVARKLSRLEAELCHRVEVNTVVSEPDAQLLRAKNPSAHIHVVDNGTDIHYFSPAPGAEEPASLIFAGSLWWYPNLSAIDFFASRIWPMVKREKPEARLYLVGRKPTPAVRRWAKRDPGIVVIADPEDVRPWLARAAVYVCPIQDGGGTRLKILDAMAMGKPVISTSIGCEGLEVTPGQEVLVADQPEQFARQVLLCLDDAALRQRLGTAGRALVETRYSWEMIARRLEDAYECARNPALCAHHAEVPQACG